MATDGWYSENFPKYKAALEDQAITLPKDSDILDDHRAVRTENGVPKVPASARHRGSDGGYRHGDSAIAFCLVWFAAANQPAGSWEDAIVVGPIRPGYTLDDWSWGGEVQGVITWMAGSADSEASIAVLPDRALYSRDKSTRSSSINPIGKSVLSCRIPLGSLGRCA